MHIKILQIVIIGFMGICMGCGGSSTEDDDYEKIEQPDLKNMVLIPAGVFLMGS